MTESGSRKEAGPRRPLGASPAAFEVLSTEMPRQPRSQGPAPLTCCEYQELTYCESQQLPADRCPTWTPTPKCPYGGRGAGQASGFTDPRESRNKATRTPPLAKVPQTLLPVHCA